jgi:hypothetical protein
MSKRGLTAFQSIALLVVSLFAALALSWMTYDIGRNRGASEILDADIIRSGFEKQASTFQKTSRTIYQELLELQHQLKMEQAVQQELKSDCTRRIDLLPANRCARKTFWPNQFAVSQAFFYAK